MTVHQIPASMKLHAKTVLRTTPVIVTRGMKGKTARSISTSVLVALVYSDSVLRDQIRVCMEKTIPYCQMSSAMTMPVGLCVGARAVTRVSFVRLILMNVLQDRVGTAARVMTPLTVTPVPVPEVGRGLIVVLR